MANNLAKNYSTIVLQKFLPGFMSDLVLAKSVDREIISGAINPQTGSTVQVKRPHQFNVIRTTDGDLTGQSTSNLISATATAEVGQMITVWVDWSQVEEALELNQLDQILMPARQKIVSTLESDLATRMMKNASLSLGSIGTAIDAWDDVAQCGAYMKDLGIEGEMYAAINPWAAKDLAKAQSGLYAADGLVKTAWENAQISMNFGGLRAFTSNGLANVTIGTASGAVALAASPTVTYSALKDTYQTTLSIDGLGAGETITAGTQLEFPATYMLNQQTKSVLVNGSTPVPFTGTVLEDATADGLGVISVTISGAPIYDATNPQYNTVNRAVLINDVVNILGTASTTYKPSLFYTKGFFGLGSVQLPKLYGWDSSVVNYDGFSIRATRSSNTETGRQALRLDMLPTFCCFNPLMGGQFAGN